jgi:hypothetical protein
MTFDWQFVVVTAIALGAALVIVRRFVPARRRPAGSGTGPVAAACDHCETGATATGAAAREAAGRTATTPVVSVGDLRKSARRPRANQTN